MTMTPGIRRLGRPRKQEEQAHFTSSPLYSLLQSRLAEPYRVDGKLNINEIAKACDVTRMTVYRWLNGFSMSGKSAKRLIQISKGALSEIDMAAFLIG